MCFENKHCLYCDVDLPSPPPHYGAIYEGKVTKILQTANLAFLDLGERLEAVLSLPERHFPKPQEGETLLVQITREPSPSQGKLAMASRAIEVPWGPFVWTPGEPGLRFSKKLTVEVRKNLESLLTPLMSEDDGLLVRSHVSAFSSEELLACHTKIVSRSFFEILKQIQHDHFIKKLLTLTTPKDTIKVDSLALYSDFTKAIASHPYAPILLHEKEGTFDENLEEAWEKMFEIHVPISGGGEIIIEKTHAFYAIDINTGQTNQPAHAFLKKAIDTAFEEIRKRDLGGIILIDIPFPPKSQGDLLGYVKREAQRDLNPPKIHGITSLGILEITRKHRSLPPLEKIVNFEKSI